MLSKVWECLDKCLQRKESDAKTILLSTEDGLLKIETDKLFYAEAMERCCELAYREKRLKVKMGIRELAEKLETSEDFMFCHRSYLVNVRKISKITKTDLILDNGNTVPVSRRLYKKVNEQFIKTMIG